MPSDHSSERQRSGRPTIDDPAVVRDWLIDIIEHNTGGPQPAAAHVPSIVGIAARASLDPGTVRSVLDTLVEEGVLERHTDSDGDVHVALT
ncbi:hypothetical protein ACFQL7_27760 [Halocatena marina]|uniref:MarR family transcriptional regulator n=1 Tax=Halocatena marina TaxID=2934937 RepID=A0ABD5YYQ7_9EURY